MNMFDQMRKDNSFRATPENVAKLAKEFGVEGAETVAQIVIRSAEKKEVDQEN